MADEESGYDKSEDKPDILKPTTIDIEEIGKDIEEASEYAKDKVTNQVVKKMVHETGVTYDAKNSGEVEYLKKTGDWKEKE